MKKTIINLLCTGMFLSSSAAFAVAAGMYTSMDIGLGNTQVKGSGTTTSSSNNIAGGLDVGYQFNNYGAMELGYTHWANGKSTAIPTCGSPIIHNDSVNLLGKGIFQIAGFSVFGKGGLGVLRSSGGGSCGASNSKTFTSVKPLVGVGVSYDLSQTWVADVTYTRLFVNSNQVANTSLLALGLSYHYVDIYCGQFLA